MGRPLEIADRCVFRAVLLLLFLMLCSAAPLSALGQDEEISARFSEPRGTKIRWQIDIPSPPPAAVIVILSIPPGTVIKEAEPPYNSYDSETGYAKWLLSRVQPGKIKMKMTLDRPIRKKGEIHGKIIFQDQEAQPIASTSIMPSRKTQKKAVEGC